MASKKERKRLKPKTETINYLYAYVSWGYALNSFKIINGKSGELITERNLLKNDKPCWFNIQNIKKEVKEYGKKLGLNTEYLGELFICIDDEGFSYHDINEVSEKACKKGIILID